MNNSAEKTMQKILSVVLCLVFAGCVLAQNAIEDNSFLLEEAYNQEKGVIQYINTFWRTRDGNWSYTFTNEMPIKTQRHQFSYTIPFLKNGATKRLGDVYINYRYQLKGMKEDEKVSISPRFSVILPTGKYQNETGTGATGFQFNFPVSVKHSKKIVTHWNAGTTFTPRARNILGQRANTKGFNLGQSTVWLAKTNFNVLVETVWGSNEAVIGAKQKQTEYSFLVNPGIRWAWNLKSGMQIVPGIAVPIGAGPSRGERGVFLYLSFEK